MINRHKNAKYEPQEASFRAKLSNQIALAKKRDIEWLLEPEEAINLMKGNCHYCNSSPSNRYSVILRNRPRRSGKGYKVLSDDQYDILYNGIDRMDNNKGYIPGNCVSCCTSCNTAKMEMSIEEFTSWFNKLKENYSIWAKEV